MQYNNTTCKSFENSVVLSMSSNWLTDLQFFSISFSVGKYLVEEILKRDDLELSFVWNRTSEALRNKIDDRYILEDLSSFAERYSW